MTVGNMSSQTTDHTMNDTNVTDKSLTGCLLTEPMSDEFFENISVAETVIIILCGLINIVTLVIFIDEIIYVLRRYKTSKQIKYKTIQLLGIFPAVGTASFVGLVIPRANVVTQQISTVYLARALFSFISLSALYFGGNKRMRAQLKDSTIAMRSPPCCCCCPCLPLLPVTRKNLYMIKMLALQFAVVQPILACVTVVLWIDGKYVEGQMSPSNAYVYLMVVSVVSMLLGLYGFMIWHNLCKEYLKPAFIAPKFAALQLVIVFKGLQEGVFSVLSKFGVPACEGILSTRVRGQAYSQMLLVFEMMLVSLLARCFYRRPHDHLAALSYNIEITHEGDEESLCHHKKNGSSVSKENGDIESKVFMTPAQEDKK